MDELALLKKSLKEDRPNAWEAIPDIELYMDQVIGYMPRQHIGLDIEETLTSAMVNNYVKKGLLPRANGKKYGREHLVHLTAICLFKQVLSVNDTDRLLKLQLSEQSLMEFYDKYRAILDQSLSETEMAINEDMDETELSDLILKLAVSSYTQKLACVRLLHLMDEEKTDKGAKDGKAKK